MWKPTAKTTVSGLHFSQTWRSSLLSTHSNTARGFSMVKLLPCAQARSRFNVTRKIMTSFHPTPLPASKYHDTSFIIPPHLKGINTPAVRWYLDIHSQDTRGGHPIDPTKSDMLHDHATSSAHSQQNSQSLYTSRGSVFPIPNRSFADTSAFYRGGGKSTMMLDTMRSIHVEGGSCLDAHSDLEVFRLCLGKASLRSTGERLSNIGVFEDDFPISNAPLGRGEDGPQQNKKRARTVLHPVTSIWVLC